MQTSLVSLFILLGSFQLYAAERTILMVDDHEVLYRSGTRRFMNAPVRHAQTPLIKEEKPWELTIGWTSVHRDVKSGKYQLWYQGYGGKRAQLKTHECVVCYAESDDGITFTRPNLGLFDFNGEKNTNIVLIGSGVYGDHYCNSVIVDEREKDASKRYKIAFNDWTKDGDQQTSGVGLATLPLDRFAGIRPEPEAPTAKVKQPPNIGQITFKPMDIKGRTEIYVNANAAGGAVWAELLDEDGYRVPGFDKESCVPLKKDALRYRFSWKDKKLTDLPPAKYHLRLHLEKASVFAITLR